MRVGRRWGGWMRERAAVCADCGVSFSAKRCAAGHERRHGGRFRSPLHGLPPLRLSFHGEPVVFFAAPAQALCRMAADELTGIYEGHALRALTDEGSR